MLQLEDRIKAEPFFNVLVSFSFVLSYRLHNIGIPQFPSYCVIILESPSFPVTVSFIHLLVPSL